ncbi:hypothetical protein ACO2Q1_16280 [Brevundimonas sp. VNH65]|uniref:hypothetical protein n=1 Tax=Brevundimonas sp. VNH65 TaxID=3400917 RepID=UPI003C0E6DE6
MTNQGPWEPDVNKMGNWRAMFEPPRRDGQPPPDAPAAASIPDDAAMEDESSDGVAREYRPWLLQRGRSRPAMMLGLRRFDARSGLWQGWGLPYPSLLAVEYVGDRMLSLDFGSRQFMIQGHGLSTLARHLKQGIVTVIQEHAASVWPGPTEGPVVTSIMKVGGEPTGQ